jgi:predicted RNA binding protein YcfA (HicA-like mRNA interferase family)
MKIRDFVKQLSDLGCAVTNTKGADQTWRTPKGNAFFLKINKMGDDITVGTLGNVMRVLKNDGFYLEGTTLHATPEAYPEGFKKEELAGLSRTRPKASQPKSKPKFICSLCNQGIDDLPHSTKVQKHLETCMKGGSNCRYCKKVIESERGLQKHETYCKQKCE